MLHLRETDRPVAEVVERLENGAADHAFGVLHIHDLRATMKNKGVEFPSDCHVLEICNPHHAKEILGRDLRVSMALPCRISVYAENGRTVVGTMLPTRMLEVFDADDAMTAVAKEVEAGMLALIEDVL